MWIKADVTFDTDEQAREAERLVRERKLAGISADLGGITSRLEVLALSDDGTPSDWLETIEKGEIVGGTLLPMPAFGDAHIALNDDGTLTAWVLPEGVPTGDRRFIQPDSLSWRDPAPLMFLDQTSQQHDGAVFVGNLSGFRRDPAGPSALVATFTVTADHFSDPLLPAVTKPHIEDGRFVGHGAQWGTCHLAFPGCITPPESKEGYQYATWKEATDDLYGVPIYKHPKGDIHAPLHLTLEETRDWYDQNCTLEGVAAVGDDTFGIWVSGDASEEIDGMFLSGDWRRVDDDLELTAFLACERPAFPLALVAADHQNALVAAGVVTETLTPDPSHEIVSRLAREVVALRNDLNGVLVEKEAERLLASLV